MSAFTYTALRNLAPGHTVNTVYSIDIDIATEAEAEKPIVKQHKSITGVTETILHRTEITHALETAVYKHGSTQALYIREIMSSTSAGEILQIDLYGSVAAPNSPVVVTIEPNGRTINNKSGRYVSFGFTVRVI